MRFYIVYKTTNVVNGKFYIGKHETTNIEDGYIGSGIVLKKAIKKYGKEKFIKEILFVYDNPQDMWSKEAELVTEQCINERKCYNACVGGNGGVGFLPKTEDHINKIVTNGMKTKDIKYAELRKVRALQQEVIMENKKKRKLKKTQQALSKIGNAIYYESPCQ